ncbi:hypothetical protein RvY_00801-2 [Ramazzottius varieornatus]|uniref:Reverse transcriptase domain-containing protein n=1 Tax=Ramazzottius varieornatus TaxID=947166 RepID=A0A1D1UHP6_RAMVA|nr:hypothetical protein RvY_00801-2 [Ramazzottius varieornatus]
MQATLSRTCSHHFRCASQYPKARCQQSWRFIAHYKPTAENNWHNSHLPSHETVQSLSVYGKQRSTEMQLLQMSHKWMQVLLERKEADIVFLDCKKAFDRLPHDVTITGLSKAGIKGQLQVLIADYLRGGSQSGGVRTLFGRKSSKVRNSSRFHPRPAVV